MPDTRDFICRSQQLVKITIAAMGTLGDFHRSAIAAIMDTKSPVNSIIQGGGWGGGWAGQEGSIQGGRIKENNVKFRYSSCLLMTIINVDIISQGCR